MSFQKYYKPEEEIIFHEQNHKLKKGGYLTPFKTSDYRSSSTEEYKVNMFSILGFSDGSDGKESACNAGDPGSIPGSGRSPGEGNGYSLQYPCLYNSMDRGAWRATGRGVPKSLTQLSN